MRWTLLIIGKSSHTTTVLSVTGTSSTHVKIGVQTEFGTDIFHTAEGVPGPRRRVVQIPRSRHFRIKVGYPELGLETWSLTLREEHRLRMF
jgi:hypothetical protein